jgi:hypothetical protein
MAGSAELPIHGRDHRRHGPDPAVPEVVFQILCTDPNGEGAPATTGYLYVVAEDDMDGLYLVDADASVSSGGGAEVMIRRDRDGGEADMLTGPIVVLGGSRTSYSGGPGIDNDNAQVLVEDFIWIDLVSDAPPGLNVVIAFDRRPVEP